MKSYKKRYRKKKKKSPFPYIFGALLFILSFSFFFYIFVFSSLFFLRGIEVEGGDEKVEEFVKGYIEKDILTKKSESVFILNLSDLEKEILKRFPGTRKVSAKLTPSLALSLDIEKREPFLTFCQSSLCFSVDKSGVVFELIEDPGKRIVFKDSFKETALGKKVIEEELSRFINKLIKELEAEEVVIESPRKVAVRLEEGWSLYFNPQKEAKEQVENMKIVLEEKISEEERKELEYMDLRFKDRVYYK